MKELGWYRGGATPHRELLCMSVDVCVFGVAIDTPALVVSHRRQFKRGSKLAATWSKQRPPSAARVGADPGGLQEYSGDRAIAEEDTLRFERVRESHNRCYGDLRR